MKKVALTLCSARSSSNWLVLWSGPIVKVEVLMHFWTRRSRTLTGGAGGTSVSSGTIVCVTVTVSVGLCDRSGSGVEVIKQVYLLFPQRILLPGLADFCS